MIKNEGDRMNCLKLKTISFAFSLAAGLPVCAEAMQWPDTAQELCYDNTKEIPCPTDENSPFYGQDAQYQGTARSYTKLGQGGVALPDDATEWIMVRDNVTGLIWEMKNNMDDTPDYTNPHDADNIYYWCDSKSTIYWSNSNSIIDGLCHPARDESYINTEDIISSINTENFGGFNDWRVPTIKELLSIFYAGLPPYVEWKYFTPTKQYYHWSSTQIGTYAWNVGPDFSVDYNNNGYIYATWAQYAVRAVRGGK
jgi:hypothetical protein